MTALASSLKVEPSHGLPATALLHLVPGAVTLLGYVGLVPVAGALGLPSLNAADLVPRLLFMRTR